MAKDIKTNIVLGGKVSKTLTNAFKTTEKQAAQLDKAFETVKNVGVKAFKAIAASATAIGTAIIASAEATRDYRSDLSKMYNNAELAGMSNQEAWGGLEDLYAMSGQLDSANEAMSNLIATGYKGEDLTKVIEAVNGATVKWQDTITQSSLADSINETVMSGKSIGQFDEILSRSGVNIDKFNDGLLACNGLAERQQYVLNWLSKSGLTEVNAAYQEQNKSLIDAHKADLKYQDSMAQLGKTAEPLASLFKGKMASAISYIASKVEGIDFKSVGTALQRVGELGKKAFDLIWQVLSKIDWEKLISAAVDVLSIFTAIFSFVVDNWSAISPLIYGIVAAMVAYKAIMIVTNTVTAIANGLKIAGSIASSLKAGATLSEAAATGVATAAQLGLNAAFLACPLPWIVLAIAALVTAFVVLWNKCEGFRNFWKNLWDGIKQAFNSVVQSIKSGLQAVYNFFQPIIEAVKTLISKIKEIGSAIANSGIGKIASGIGSAVSWVGEKIGFNAEGSTITSPTLTWVGEGGDTETIVPHNNKPRSRALALEAVRGTGVSLGGGTYVFSPTINVSGGNSADINGIMEDAFLRFKAMLQEYEQEKVRMSY